MSSDSEAWNQAKSLLADNQTATGSGDAVVNFIFHLSQILSVARDRAIAFGFSHEKEEGVVSCPTKLIGE